MVITGKISLKSRGERDILDITPQVAQQVTKAEINSGVVTLFVAGSTAGLTTIEFEPGLISDFQSVWERVAPKSIPYNHDRRWGDGNGYSHVQASLLGASLVVPFHKQKLTLGTWQQIVVVDFDNRPRSRQVIVQIMGD
ncbi:MAG: secondary thiamine-phosphate synthase enzyme YjbQ [Dehalococcoidales bacterium]|jgi:secondary thiamine-phosphate synthase enzyme|nr:secondary thiamine-phosphate synthase enzyme YjbQ [Dehalococcoidales bacterium]MDP7286274.1 secondary thiamine-phosphate synthase enzyme YjbQ [Dehalococcoidales bacterium]MDP7415362.1 secondary thiamine-phosphate synthase enzyme YjbQ [Dehalococcoidales bacterium]